MALRRINAPAAPPVSTSEAKAHLRVEHTADDTLIAAMVEAAVGHLDAADGVLGRCLVTQTWELVLDAFPDTCGRNGGAIRVPLPPLASVVSLKYLDANLDEVTLVEGDDFTVDKASQPGWVIPGEAGWPTTGDTVNAVALRFTAGYGIASAVPAPLKAAILLMVGDLYENREGGGAKLEVNPTVDRLIEPYRIPYFG